MKITREQYLKHLVTIATGLLRTEKEDEFANEEYLAYRSKNVLDTLLASVPDAGPNLIDMAP